MLSCKAMSRGRAWKGEADLAFAQAVAATMRSCRLRLGLSQQELAERADLGVKAIGDVEQAVVATTALRIWKILCPVGIALGDFFGEVDARLSGIGGTVGTAAAASEDEAKRG